MFLDSDNSSILALLIFIGGIVGLLHKFGLFEVKPLFGPPANSSNKPNQQPKSKPVRSYEDSESRQLFNLIDELTRTFKIKVPINDRTLKKHFDDRNFAGCISEIKKQMGLNNRILLRCYSDEKYPRDGSYGFIEIPNNIPLINTPAFNNFKMVVSIKESTKISYETFIYTLSHELSHALLFSMRHPLKESEEATDLLVLIMGFGNIMRKGIKDERKTGHYARDGFTQFTQSRTIICGYLGETNFEFVYRYIGEQYSKLNQY